MTVYFPGWHSHCTRTRFRLLLWRCGNEVAVHICPLIFLQRQVAKFASVPFYRFSLRNSNMAINLERCGSRYGSRRFAVCDCWTQTSLSGNTARQWLLTTVSQVVLYCMKRSMPLGLSDRNKVMLWPGCEGRAVWNLHKNVRSMRFVVKGRRGCCNLSAGVALNARFTTNGMCAQNNTTYIWREQAIIKWLRRVISIVACCHSAKLCAHAARAFPIARVASESITHKVKWVLFCVIDMDHAFTASSSPLTLSAYLPIFSVFLTYASVNPTYFVKFSSLLAFNLTVNWTTWL